MNITTFCASYAKDTPNDLTFGSTMSSSSHSETLVENTSDVKMTSPTEVFFHTMKIYVADMPCSPLKRQKLDDLVTQMREEWTNILSEKEPMPTPIYATPIEEPTLELKNQRDPLKQLTTDLICASLSAALKAGPDGPTQYKLTRDYTFGASLGPKVPLMKPIYAAIGVPSRPEIVLIKYPGRRINAIDVGYCSQYDSEVFFGDDGLIYLVDFEQMKQNAEVSKEGMKIFESDEKLDSDWRTFSDLYDN